MVIQKKNKRIRWIVACLLLITAAVVALNEWLPVSAGRRASRANGSACSLYSSHAVLMRLEDGEILLDRNGGQSIFPASLTKIMTVLVAIEHTDDLRRTVTMDPTWYDELIAADAAMAGFLPGERVTVKDLMAGAILASGAECCAALAAETAGNQTGFVDMMNQKAQEIGMNSTHFSNATGLHNEQHVTTAKDLALLLRRALQNKTFRTIFTTKRYSVRPTNRHPQGITLTSSLFTKMSSASFPGGQILGGKTGYTNQAGLCLATLAVRDGTEYILITAGANGDHRTEQYNILDAMAVYNQSEFYEP